VFCINLVFGSTSSLNIDLMELMLQWSVVHRKAGSTLGVAGKPYDYQVEGNSLEEIANNLMEQERVKCQLTMIWTIFSRNSQETAQERRVDTRTAFDTGYSALLDAI